jgi:hypothetical protein
MPPSQLTDLAQAIEAFNTLTLPAMALLIVLILVLVFGFLLRSVFGRDKRRDDLLQFSMNMSTGFSEAVKEMKVEFSSILKETSQRGLKADQKFAALLEQSNILQTQNMEQVKALDARTGSQVTISQQNQVLLQTVVKALDDLKTQVASLEESLETRFPKVSEFKSEFEELKTSIDKVAEKCAEEAKKATDESPVLDPLTLAKLTPESDIPLPPGGDTELPKAS